MSKLRFATREIGKVRIFDLMGEPKQEDLQEVAWRIQKSIRIHRLQRVILNMQKIKTLDEIGIRKLVAAFLRPQKSGIYGVEGELRHQLEDTYLPQNVKICATEKEVAEDFGPFLFHKDEIGNILGAGDRTFEAPAVGTQMEHRRSKRMHVAIPLEVKIHPEDKEPILIQAISTNISEGGIFIEFLDLDAAKAVEELDPIQDLKTEILIHPSANFPEEYHLEGGIRRREIRKRGLGLAIQFTSNL